MYYKELESKLYEVGKKFDFGGNKGVSPFKGRNFLTPDVVMIGRYKNGVWFELSYGTGFEGDWLFGVTFMRAGVKMLEESTACHSIEEVEEVLTKVLRTKEAINVK